MAVNNPYQQYRQSAVMSAGSGELTLMLYNGAVKFIKQGLDSIDRNCIDEASNAILRVQEIISYLTETLNWDYEISQNLAGLYIFLNRRLAEANVKKDKEVLMEVLTLIEEMRQTWQQAIKAAQNQGR